MDVTTMDAGLAHNIYSSMFVSSTTKPDDILGGSVSPQGLQSGHGIPGAPQMQARFPSHGRSGWASQTHSGPSQFGQAILSPETKSPKLGEELEAV